MRQFKFLEKLRKGALRVASRLVTRSDAKVKFIYEVRPVEDGWMIAEKGSELPLRIFVKKQDAIREARRMAREHHTQVDVFGRDGSRQNQYSFVT
jgi:2-hydroxychromene-2-carboxylate isomerase